ncbi:FAR1-related sequence 5-like protein [Tanacetum coccineum]
MVVIDDHDMIDTGEGSTPRDVIDTGEGSIPRDVFDVGEGSIPKDVQDVNIESIEGQEQIDLPDIESNRNDPDFAPTPNGTPYWRPDLPKDEKPMMSDIFDTFDDVYNMYKVYAEKGRFNIGPTLAHRLKVALMGGYDKVRGTPRDYRNFKRAVNLFIGDRDAQMMVDKMINRQLYVPEFSFEHHVLHDELVFHRKQPQLSLTDQDATLRNAVVKMFPDSTHRLCMWHITQKLPGKVLGDLEADSEFRKEFHKLIWNVYIGPEVFEKRWNALINRYNFQDNKWLSDMYAIRDR